MKEVSYDKSNIHSCQIYDTYFKSSAQLYQKSATYVTEYYPSMTIDMAYEYLKTVTDI